MSSKNSIHAPRVAIFTILILVLAITYRSQRASTDENVGTTTTAETPASAPKEVQMVDKSSPWQFAERNGYDADYEKAAQAIAHKINRVVVYSDRAKIFRGGFVKVKPGFHWMVFSELPANFDKQSLRINGGPGFSGRIAQVVIQDSFEHVNLPEHVQSNLNELRKLYATLLDQMHQEQAFAKQYGFVQGLTLEAPFTRNPASKEYKSFSASPKNLNVAMDEIKNQSREFTTRLIRIQEQVKKTNDLIEYRQNQIQNVTDLSEQKKKSHVYVLVQSDRAVDTTLEVSYMINNAFWRPVYDVRADLASRDASASVELVTAAMVEQHTGENWDNVSLTVSTLDPAPLFLPRLQRWAFSEKRVEAPAVAANKKDSGGARREAFAKGGLKNDRYGNEGTGSDKAVAYNGPVSAPAPSEAQALAQDKLEPVGALAATAGQLQAVTAGKAPGSPAANENKSARISANHRAKSLDSSTVLAKQKAAVRKGALLKQSGDSAGGGGGAEFDEGGSQNGALVGRLEADPESDGFDYVLKPLEEFFPTLNQTKTTLSQFQSQVPDSDLYEVAGRRGAPGRNNYQDATLPAVAARGRNIELTSPFRVTVKSDDPAQKIPMTSQTLKADLFYFAIPKKDVRVYLRAKTINSTQFPLLAGPAQIFMNGDLVSKTNLPSISEGGSFSFDLGSDAGLEAKRVVKTKVDDTGFFKKSHRNDVDVKIDIVNHHAFAVKVELKDNYPLSPNDDIVVDLKNRKPSSEKEAEDGLLLWKLTIPAKSKHTVSFDYSVTYPENFIISEDSTK